MSVFPFVPCHTFLISLHNSYLKIFCLTVWNRFVRTFESDYHTSKPASSLNLSINKTAILYYFSLRTGSTWILYIRRPSNLYQLFSLSVKNVCYPAYVERLNEILQLQPVCVCSHLNYRIVWTGHGATVGSLPQKIMIKWFWGKWIGTWELAQVKTRIVLLKRNSWHSILKVRFLGVSQTPQTPNLTAIQRTANFSLISKSVCTNCPHLGANFPLQITIQRQFIIILHVDVATRYTEIPITRFIDGDIAQQRNVTNVLPVNYVI